MIKPRMDSGSLIALISYVVITAIMFLPLLAHMSSATLTPNFGGQELVITSRDRYHFLWNFWWVGKSIASHQNPLTTNLMFYPTGISLGLQTVDFVDGTFAAGLSVFTGQIAAYNVIILASLILSGFTAFLLARHLTGSWIAGFGAGIIFAYFPQHVYQAFFGHPNLTSLEWLPAFLLAIMLTFEKGKYRYAIVAGALLAVLTLTELELLIIALIIALVFLPFYAIRNIFSLGKRFLFLLGTTFFVWLALSGPYILAAYETLVGGVHSPPPLANALNNAAKPMLYLTPPPNSLFYGTFFSPSYSPLSPFLLPHAGGPSQWVIFVGYAALALAAIGVITSKDQRRFPFLALAVIAFVISLGPSANPSTLSIQTPYTILYNSIPILHFFRAEARFSILLMLSISVLASMGILSVLHLGEKGVGSIQKRRWKLVGLVILAILLLEFVPTVALGSIASDPVYSIIAQDHSNFAVLELPGTVSVAQPALYQQTLYDKPLVDGKISQASFTLPPYMFYQLFLRVLARPNKGVLKQLRSELVDQPHNEYSLAPLILTMYNIKYVIVDYTLLSPYAYNVIMSALTEGLGPPVYHDSQVILFELQHWVSPNSIIQQAQVGPIVLFGQGWSPQVKLSRVASNYAQLVVFAAQPGMYSVAVNSTVVPLCIKNLNSSQSISCGNENPVTGELNIPVFLTAGENLLSLRISASSALISYIKVSEPPITP